MTDERSILVTGGGGMLAHGFKKLIPAATFLDRAALDITESGDVARVFAEHRPSLVINCAAYTNVDRAEQEEPLATAINGHAVATLARECAARDVPLVHFSSDYVFDGTKRRPLKPDDAVGPRSAYGRSKLLGEALLKDNASQRWLIIRTAWLYGPDGACFPKTIINAARAGKPLSVIDDQVGSPTYTLDLARAALELIDRGASGIWHVANAGETNWHDFAAAILEEFAIEANLTRTTSSAWKHSRPQSADRPAYSVLDVAPFAELVGRNMRPWREALRDYKNVSGLAG